MKIRTKILGGFLIIAFLGLLLGGTTLVLTFRLSGVSDSQREFQKEVKEFTDILSAHYTWRNNLTEAILTGTEFTGSLDPDGCLLGTWMKSDSAGKVDDPEIVARLGRVKDPHDFIHNEARNVLELLENGERDAALDVLQVSIFPKLGEVITELTGIMTSFNELIDVQDARVERIGSLTVTITIIMIEVVLGASILLAFLLTNSIIKPLSKMTKAAQSLAIGDLDVNAEHNVNDHIGRLAASFRDLVESTKQQVSVAEMLANGDLTAEVKPRSDKDAMGFAILKMLDKLNDMFSEIVESTSLVSTGAQQIANGSQSLARGSTEQAAAIEELSTSVAAIAAITKENADMADKAAKLASSIRGSAEKGSNQMDEMIKAVAEINQSSQNISKVIKVIDDIAFQTNILALNAAVEAARAGQHGKGFAVVAEEVRNLASKSAEAAKDTGAMIQDSMSKAEMGSRIAGETAASLTEIVSGVNESTHLVNEIAKSSEEQSNGITHINEGIEQVSMVVQQNSATAEQSAAASQQMSGQSAFLQKLISRFNIKGGGQEYQTLPPALVT